jgi:hypothetical protein
MRVPVRLVNRGRPRKDADEPARHDLGTERRARAPRLPPRLLLSMARSRRLLRARPGARKRAPARRRFRPAAARLAQALCLLAASSSLAELRTLREGARPEPCRPHRQLRSARWTRQPLASRPPLPVGHGPLESVLPLLNWCRRCHGRRTHTRPSSQRATEVITDESNNGPLSPGGLTSYIARNPLHFIATIPGPSKALRSPERWRLGDRAAWRALVSF